MKVKIFNWIAIAFGSALILYGLIGIERYGFYISGRQSIGQTEGGLAPLFLLIGFMSICYGAIQLKLERNDGTAKSDISRSLQEKTDAPPASDHPLG